MTRINVGVDPRELPDKLLLTEHREITRIPNAVKSGRANLQLPAPAQFTLGPGHVRFFYTRLGYLKRRYALLFEECLKRGFNVTDKSEAFAGLPVNCLWDFQPTRADRQIIVQRLVEKHGSLCLLVVPCLRCNGKGWVELDKDHS